MALFYHTFFFSLFIVNFLSGTAPLSQKIPATLLHPFEEDTPLNYFLLSRWWPFSLLRFVEQIFNHFLFILVVKLSYSSCVSVTQGLSNVFTWLELNFNTLFSAIVDPFSCLCYVDRHTLLPRLLFIHFLQWNCPNLLV